jgi:putative ABC transport system ATP-binding protein
MSHSSITSAKVLAGQGRLDPANPVSHRRRMPLRRFRVTASPLTTETEAVRAVDVRKSYGKAETAVTALAGVSFEVPRGQFCAVMGPSGSGKSTLMHCMAGLDRVDSGDVQIGGVSIVGMGDKALTALRRDRVGFVFQQYNLLPTLTAEENITLPLAIAGRKPDAAWMAEVVKAVGLGDRLSHRPAELSGGQQQRVACARALVTRPDVVFADEPTGNLDSRAGAEVLSFLARCVEEFGQTIVMVTHDPVAASYAGRVVFLADGLVVDEMVDPTPERVLDRMKQFDVAGHLITDGASQRAV